MSFTPFNPFRAFGGGAVLSLDPAAAAYIAALETAGATVSPTQSAAIDAFIVAEKAGSRWDLIKRLYLPIWGAAGPNAICMRSLTSGTFVGAVMHALGVIHSNGGHFDFGVSPSALGMTAASGFLLAMNTTSFTYYQTWLGVLQAGVGNVELRGNNGGGCFSEYFNSGTRIGENTPPTVGIIARNRFDGSSVVSSLTGSGRSVLTTLVHANGGSPPTIPFYGLSRNSDGTSNLGGISRVGCLEVGMGMADSQMHAHTLNLKTLWETCTGLTLP